jgi:hypothetical protein
VPKQAESHDISARLDALLRIVLDYQRKNEGTNVGDQILILQDAGLSQTDAGHILGVEGNQIPSYLRGAENKKLKDKLDKKRKSTMSK